MHRNGLWVSAGVLAAAVAAGGGLLSAQTVPKPTGYVSDHANVLSARSRNALTARLEAVDRQMAIQIAVVTVKSLDGQTVERYANRVFNDWGIGQAGTDTGVLVLVAPRDRQMRIEVGNGLDRVLTDAVAKGVVDGYFLPAFRQERVQQGIEAGVDRIITILQARPALPRNGDIPVERAAPTAAPWAPPSKTTPFDGVLAVLRVVPRPIQFLLLVIGLTVGAERMGKGLREHVVLAPMGLLIGAAAITAWWFPFSGWGIPGWLLLGSWTWVVFSSSWKPSREASLGRRADTSEPTPASPAVAASEATSGDEPRLFRNYTRGDSFSHDDEPSRRSRRDRDWGDSGSSGSSGFGGFGGGSSSGGGASGKW
jgi:uncharacterized membrane protein YgcG